MIQSFRHKGLKRLYAEDNARGLQAVHVAKLRRILARLEAAKTIDEMDLPGYRLHSLKGALDGFYAVTVQANWRVIFRFEQGDAFDLDYVDYH